MDRSTDLESCVATSEVYRSIVKSGFIVEEVKDFDTFKELCKERTGRPVSAYSDSDFFDFTEGNSFFFAIFDKEKNLVGTIAGNVSDLGKTSLANFMSKQAKRLHGGEVKDDHAPYSYEISGRVVYVGDLWVLEKYRGRDMFISISQLALLWSLRFDPEYAWALFLPRMAEKGLAIKMGYSIVEPEAICWKKPPADFSADFYLGATSKRNIQRLASRIFDESHQT